MFDITLQMGTAFMLAGPSSCGKSTFVKNLITHRNAMFNRTIENVYIVCANAQSIYENLVQSGDVKEIYRQMPSKNEIIEIAQIGKKQGGTILILDDILSEISKSNILIQEIFIYPCLCGVVGKASDFKSDFSGSSQGHPFASSNLQYIRGILICLVCM